LSPGRPIPRFASNEFGYHAATIAVMCTFQKNQALMPVIRISDATYAALQRHAKPFEDSPESIIVKALKALDAEQGIKPKPFVIKPPPKKNGGTKLPQKEFRLPLLITLLELGGTAPVKLVHEKIEPLLAARLNAADYEKVSSGELRWWNAVCWERNQLVKEGLMKDGSDRGVWEIGEGGKKLETTLHWKHGRDDKMTEHGGLEK
jgi:hypothetical protein